MVAIDEVKREKEGNVQVERRRRKNRLVERRKSADGLKCDDTKPFSVPCGVPTPKADERIHRKRVQLWKGGPYWAETNIGAEKPWESGFYFWWGDTVGYKRENGVWVANKGSATNFSFAKEKALTCDKPNSNEWTTADGVLTSKYDAAIVQLGDGWRMPTQQELDDLCKKCDWTWTTTNGVNGYVVRGRDDYASNHIFLPCAGFGYGTSLSNFGSDG